MSEPAPDALSETLELLEWPRLAGHVAGFASTVAGARHCAELPLPASCAESRKLLAETSELLGLDGVLEGGLSFRGVADIAATVSLCAKGGSAGGEALLAVATTLAAARRLRRQIEDGELRPVCSALVADLRTLPELEQRLHFALEEGGRVADRASAELAGLRRQLQGLRAERRERLQELIRRWAALLQDTVVSERNGRPVLAVKAGAASSIRGLVHDSSASGSTVFVEPQAVIPLGNRLRDLEGRERELEEAIRRGLSALVGEEAPALEHLQAVLVRLDAGLARARYGAWLGAVRPELIEPSDAPFELRDLRHPLLLWQERREGGRPVVPVSLAVGPDLRVVAITGPNTGGKTVTLKSVGLAALMARAGLFLPCRGTPRLPWCGRVLADIGDEQSLQQNLSTFSGHIRRIGRILAELPDAGGGETGEGASLVLLDEVGAGTDPAEGAALAAALLRHLADRARLTIATTHFGELKALKYADPRFENASVAFDGDTLSPTYHLLWGIPGRSNALAIAGRLGLPAPLLAEAAAALEPGAGGDVNQVIEGLERERRRQQEAAEAAAAMLARTELLHEELLERWRQQKEQSVEQQEQRRQQLERSIREGQGEVRRLIRRLRQAGRAAEPQAAGETARQAGRRLRALEEQHRPAPQRREHGGWRPAVGDRVRLLALGKAAEVLAMSDDGLELTVRCGVLRSTVPLSAIEGLQGEKPGPPPPPPPQVTVRSRRSPASRGPQVRTEGNTVDVRGLRVHEAEATVEEKLRGANGPLWVIHGIGTGKLKRGLREWLATVPYVERVADAEQGDGGPGCSVIWVK